MAGLLATIAEDRGPSAPGFLRPGRPPVLGGLGVRARFGSASGILASASAGDAPAPLPRDWGGGGGGGIRNDRVNIV